MKYHFILRRKSEHNRIVHVSETNHPEGYAFNELKEVINDVTTLHLMEKPENMIQEIYPKIDWEQIFEDAQTMHLLEFINHQKEKLII